MDELRLVVIGAALLAGLSLFGCDKGPAQEIGRRIDRATDQDKIIGRGPVEKAGRMFDKAVDDLKK